MNAELRRAPDTEFWTPWEGQTVGGEFPLRRLLGCTSDSAVFLTEFKAKNVANAAIKFVRADASQAKVWLAQWKVAAPLSHPHLVRLFGMGQYRSDGDEFVFVVMEYAEQTLAEILRRRPLSPEEARELLVPTIDALTFLHRREWVHGQLKPSNILAVDDSLKLASDTIRPTGRTTSGIATAEDVWKLGATLVEALTQRAPAGSDSLELPAGVPEELVETVRRCLSPTPAERPTIIELRSQYKSVVPAEPAPAPSAPVVARETSPPAAVITRETSPPAPTVARETPPRPAPAVARETPPSPTPIVAREASPPPTAPAVAREAPPPPNTVVARGRPSPSRAPAVAREMSPPPAPGVARETSPPPAHAVAREASLPPARVVTRETSPSPAPAIARETQSPPASAVARDTSPPPSQASQKRSLSLPIIAASLAIAAVVWFWLRSPGDSPQPELQATVVPAPTPAVPAAITKPAPTPPKLTTPASPPPEANSTSVLNEVLPDVPVKISNKIQGRVYVTVRVLVDPSGEVIGVLMENPGPSKYFARLAEQAAHNWQFAPADTEGNRVWLVRFLFTRDGVSARPMEQ